MIRINQVKLPVEHTTEALHKKVQELLKYKGSMDVEIVKRSLDARKKPQLFYVYMLDVTIPEKEERKLLKRCRGSQIQKVESVKYVFPVKHYEDCSVAMCLPKPDSVRFFWNGESALKKEAGMWKPSGKRDT